MMVSSWVAELDVRILDGEAGDLLRRLAHLGDVLLLEGLGEPRLDVGDGGLRIAHHHHRGATQKKMRCTEEADHY